MTTLQILSTLPALLGFTGVIIFYFFQRNRSGDQITLNIVSKLRAQAPGSLPPNADKLDAAALARLLEGDITLRSRIDDQDFQLLRDALRHQFVTSLVVYGASGVIFLVGVGLYVYMNPPANPAKLSNFVIQGDNPAAKGLAVDLDDLTVRWSARGNPEDVDISLQEMERDRRTATKKVRSSEGKVTFTAADYRPILLHREHNAQNRLRVVSQALNEAFLSAEFPVFVGTTITVVNFDNEKIKIMGTIDNRAIDYYDFEAKLVIQQNGANLDPAIIGGKIKYGKNDFAINSKMDLDWGSRKLVYFGPDDPRRVRTEYLGF